MAIQAFVDESGGEGQGTVFVCFAVISSAEHWAIFCDSWQACLDRIPSRSIFQDERSCDMQRRIYTGFLILNETTKLKSYVK